VSEQKTELAPLRDELADEAAEACAMLSFLMYENGLGLKPLLKENYEKEEHRKNQEAAKQRAEKLEILRRKLKNAEVSPEEYILELEKQLKLFEKENAQIDLLYKDIAALQNEKEALGEEIGELESDIARITAEGEARELKHAEEIDRMKEDMNRRIHENLLKYEAEAHELERECNERLALTEAELREAQDQCREDVAAAREERRAIEYKYDTLEAEYKKIAEAKILCEARLKAIRAQYGLMTAEDDFTEKEDFDELEKEFEAFERFYESQWDQTKKKIRKSILNFDNLTGRKRHK
jgi:chromosome segregation ATPase